ncbi:hypothetical protein GCM10009733_101820 [Nonomuraea maheshkhaliensis]|uniref:Uncharacterized protein n=1 Tax=Nonomuraea maheshkhaliensis TaxID=419590 RepID=A0ABP4TJ24_9ACTN
MDHDVTALLGIDLDDPDVQRESAAVERDMRLIEAPVGVRRRLGPAQSDGRHRDVWHRVSVCERGDRGTDRPGGPVAHSWWERPGAEEGRRLMHGSGP